MNDNQRCTQFARRAMVHSVVRSSIDCTARQAESAAQHDASPSDNGEKAIQSGVDQAGQVVENTAYTSRRISYTKFRALQAKSARNDPAADAESGQVRREAFKRGRFRALAIEKSKPAPSQTTVSSPAMPMQTPQMPITAEDSTATVPDDVRDDTLGDTSSAVEDRAQGSAIYKNVKPY